MTMEYNHTHWRRRGNTDAVSGVPYVPLRALLKAMVPDYSAATHHVHYLRAVFFYNPERPILLRYSALGEKRYFDLELDRVAVHAWLDANTPEWRRYFPRLVLHPDGVLRPY